MEILARVKAKGSFINYLLPESLVFTRVNYLIAFFLTFLDPFNPFSSFSICLFTSYRTELLFSVKILTVQ